MIDIRGLTIQKTQQAFKEKTFSVKDLVEVYLKNINSKNKELNAYLEVFSNVLAEANVAQKRINSGDGGLLTGIPIAIKDNILVSGKKASAGSKILEGFISPYDSTVISKLKNEGAIILGRTNMDEFAMGSSTENSAYGPTGNPHDTESVAGGSSGGSAAAVSAGLSLAALGSDTGGSVRQPASFCGCVGLKPTYGAVSRFGLMALGSSLDQIGPITNSVEDSRIIFDAIKGTDAKDSTSFYEEKEKIKPKKIGIPTHLLKMGGIHPDVLANFDESVKIFEKLGFQIKEIELPNVKYSLAVYYVIMPAEASSNLARYDGIRYGFHSEGENIIDDYFSTRGLGFGPEPRRRIMLGTYVLSSGYYDAYYNRAVAVKSLIKSDFKNVFKDVDVVILPTTPTPAFKKGEKTKSPLEMYLADIFTVPANISGLPAISVPSGFSKSSENAGNLPLGLQIIAPEYCEDRLFDVGGQFFKVKNVN